MSAENPFIDSLCSTTNSGPIEPKDVRAWLRSLPRNTSVSDRQFFTTEQKTQIATALGDEETGMIVVNRLYDLLAIRNVMLHQTFDALVQEFADHLYEMPGPFRTEANGATAEARKTTPITDKYGVLGTGLCRRRRVPPGRGSPASNRP